MTGAIGTPCPRRGLILLWIVALAMCATLLLTVAPRARTAHEFTHQRLVGYSNLVRSAEELARLRGAVTAPELAGSAGAADEPKLATMVSGTLSAAGLPSSTLSSLSPESESTEWLDAGTPPPGGRGQRSALVRRRATVVLTPVTLPQLGRFLSAWHDQAPRWTPARIDIEPRREKNVQPGADLPLRVTLAIESVSLQHRARSSP